LERALDRADDRGTAKRSHNRLFDGLIERTIHSRNVGHPLSAPGAGGQQAGYRRLASIGRHVNVIIGGRPVGWTGGRCATATSSGLASSSRTWAQNSRSNLGQSKLIPPPPPPGSSGASVPRQRHQP